MKIILAGLLEYDLVPCLILNRNEDVLGMIVWSPDMEQEVPVDLHQLLAIEEATIDGFADLVYRTLQTAKERERMMSSPFMLQELHWSRDGPVTYTGILKKESPPKHHGRVSDDGEKS